MADEIINFYKKAKEPEEPQKPIEEQKETPVPVIPKSDEPFDRFLLELAEKLQNEKVITEKQQETFVEQIKEPVSTDPNENDPFKKFIGSLANILKEDELVNREENIKEATISFINKLKEQNEMLRCQLALNAVDLLRKERECEQLRQEIKDQNSIMSYIENQANEMKQMLKSVSENDPLKHVINTYVKEYLY